MNPDHFDALTAVLPRPRSRRGALRGLGSGLFAAASLALTVRDGETKKKGDVFDEDVLVEEAEKVGLIKKGSKGWTCLGETFSAKSHIDRRLLTDPLFNQTLRWATLRVIVEADKMWGEEEPMAPTTEQAAALEAEAAKVVETET